MRARTSSRERAVAMETIGIYETCPRPENESGLPGRSERRIRRVSRPVITRPPPGWLSRSNLTRQSAPTCHFQPDARLLPVCCRFGRWPERRRLFPLLIIFPLPISSILMFRMAPKSNLRDAASMFGPVIYQHTRTELRLVFCSLYAT